MQQQDNSATGGRVSDAEARRYQFIFMAVGMAIIIGGLWFLYQGNAPYHPEAPITQGISAVPEES